MYKRIDWKYPLTTKWIDRTPQERGCTEIGIIAGLLISLVLLCGYVMLF